MGQMGGGMFSLRSGSNRFAARGNDYVLVLVPGGHRFDWRRSCRRTWA
jgi:hypothetical protein